MHKYESLQTGGREETRFFIKQQKALIPKDLGIKARLIK